MENRTVLVNNLLTLISIWCVMIKNQITKL